MEGRDPRNKSAVRRRLKKLRRTYRLVILNRRTFEEKFSLDLNPLNSLLLVGGAFLVFGALLIGTIAFTPLKRDLPGFPGEEMEERSIEAVAKADSLERELITLRSHFDRIRSAIQGNGGDLDSLEGTKSPPPPADPNGGNGRGQKAFRSSDEGNSPLFQRYFFPPLRGAVTDVFDRGAEHFGVDVTASEGEAIKATLEGTVTFASWTPDQGNVIQVQHPNGMLSVYKHNSVLLKETGQRVRSGDAIAIIGNTGELTTGPHLHFEFWYQGDPIDPEDLLVF